MSVYYVMSTQYSDAFNKPKIAKYDNDKWAISGDAPKDFSGEVVDLSNPELELTIEEFVFHIDSMRAEEPTGRLLIIPQWVGQWLYENHEAFKPAGS